MQIVGIVFNNTNKTDMVSALSLAMEQHGIEIYDPVVVSELQSYEMQRLPSGNWRYSAPENAHDDCVSALMLAHHAAGMRPAVAQQAAYNPFIGGRPASHNPTATFFGRAK